MAGRFQTNAFIAGAGSGLSAAAGMWFGYIEPSEAACFGAGGVLVSTILAITSKDVADALHPARVELVRFRRSEKAADVLVVEFSRPPSLTCRSEGRRNARTAASVLRVTDGVAVVPSLRGHGLCAVIAAGDRARAAIESRLRSTCGSDVRVGWASFPDDGVTLESLIATASDRSQERLAPPPASPIRQTLPERRLASRGLDPARGAARRVR